MRRVRLRYLVAAVTAAAVGAGVALAVAGSSSGPAGEGGSGRAVPAVASVSRPRAHPGPLGPEHLIVTLHSATTYSHRMGGPAAGTLGATNPFGQPQVLAVVQRDPAAGWTEVELPVRPDGSLGWIRTSNVVLTETTYRVAVSVEARTLTVYDGHRTVLTTPVAVGAPDTPTPDAHTYLWELIRPIPPDGAYGPYIFGLALFSNAYSIFNGGDAQIGIHGQDEPWSIGHAVSHGCVRLPNNVIADLAKTLPLGTPVTIS